MRHLVANQNACIRAAVIRDRKNAIRGHDIRVKINHSLAGDGSARGAHAVRRVACGTGKARVDVAAVLIPTGVLHNLVR